MKAPNASDMMRKRSAPISVPRTLRMQSLYGMTSLPAGRMVPIAMAGLLREDAVRSGRLTLSFEHTELAEVLMNKINVQVQAYFVPMLAMPRFNGSIDALNRAYEGLPPLPGQPVVPFIETMAMPAHGAADVFKYLGLHAAPGRTVNNSVLQTYNLIWNYKAKNRSPKLTQRLMNDASLAPAFWLHDQFAHMVPNFDAATIDGKVPLNVVDAKMPIRGLGISPGTAGSHANYLVHETGVGSRNVDGWLVKGYDGATTSGQAALVVEGTNNLGTLMTNVFAELQQNGIAVSLANIELARKTQAFAELRKMFSGHSDDYVIDHLMNGIRIDDQYLKDPILVASARTFFGQSKRFATDAANLSVAAVDGMTQLQMNIRVPQMNTGGVLMVVAEITPDQLFERQEDPWFCATHVADLPQYLRDELDPEKVDIVRKSRVDTAHSDPNGTFAYEPMNARWNVMGPRIGGVYYRPVTNTATDSDRQKIWSVETVDPVLGPDFYLCTNMHLKPFLNRNRDPFEVITQGDLEIEGNTVFGAHLIEANPTNDYDKVFAEAPQDRIEQVV